jgi:DNA adenine methylase
MPTRPALRYYGNGWTRAGWTAGYLRRARREVYCEPSFGAGSVFFHLEPAKLEIINDLDSRVMNFFWALRSWPAELVRLILLTPWAEAEYRKCLEPAGEDEPLEDARRFFLACWASVKGGPNAGPSDFRWQKKNTRRSAAVQDIASLSHLMVAAERLKNAQILCRDALDVIGDMRGTGALIYFDPPYLAETRKQKNGYRFEPDESWHEEAARLLRGHDGPVVVAGYRSALYQAEYEAFGWQRVERRQMTNSGGSAVECLWLSPLAQEGA